MLDKPVKDTKESQSEGESAVAQSAEDSSSLSDFVQDLQRSESQAFAHTKNSLPNVVGADGTLDFSVGQDRLPPEFARISLVSDVRQPNQPDDMRPPNQADDMRPPGENDRRDLEMDRGGDAEQLDKTRVQTANDRGTDSPPPNEPPELTQSRERIRKLAEERFKDPEQRRRFLEDMEAFEKRARDRGLSPDETRKTYEQITKLLEANNLAIDPRHRENLAAQIMRQAARPETVDQGQHPTCSVSSEENRMFTRNPSLAAEMIVTAAITGQWTAPDGKVIKIDRGSLIPDAEAANALTLDGDRSFASQIFNVVAINDILQRENPPRSYRESPPTRPEDRANRSQVFDDNGKLIGDFQGLTARQIQDQITRLTGDRGVVITSPRDEADLRRQLQELKERGQLPALIVVDANHPTFSMQPNHTGGRWHMIAINDYDPATGKVTIDNQWGSGHDHKVDASQLFEATSRYRAPRPWYDPRGWIGI